ncbi:MAG: dihydroneopterin triphosphate diphosphatase [Thermomicrobiales bacterium]|nr:dihydroneopterin triphosphate diphosphatase [Thermomicrobiales bacterium]
MPRIAADIVDAYVFRRLNGRTQFLLLRRRADVSLAGTWQGIHGTIEVDESAVDAATRTVLTRTGIEVVDAYSADYVNQFYDHHTDTLILAPVFAFPAPPKSRVTIGEEYSDFAWCERDEATGRLVFAGQRWAVRHIDDVIAPGGPEAELYRIR